MNPVRVQFATRAARDGFVRALVKVGNGKPEIAAFDDKGRPARIKHRTDGERSVEIEVVRE